MLRVLDRQPTYRKDLQQQALAWFQQQDYVQATALYRQLVEQAPDQASNYWHLGLSLLLQGNVDEAQGVWMTVFIDSGEALDDRLLELSSLLRREYKRQ